MQNTRSEPGVSATEDLMREHGVLRRALIVYAASAAKLRRDPLLVPPPALQRTAILFRVFGENYHEKQSEETYVFPTVKQLSDPAASYPDILLAQHQRGREITEFILTATRSAKLGGKDAEVLADALDSFARMYHAHSAREDTIIFPSWKQALTAAQFEELSEKFEEIEHEQFGADGFDEALKQIGNIEQELGIQDLTVFTAPMPQTANP